MTVHFNNKERRTGFHDAQGTGDFTVTVPFLPDYLKAKFATQGSVGNEHDGKASATDTIYWELVASVTPGSFDFTVYYNCVHPRSIHWLVTKLPKDAEIIAH